MSNDNLPAPEAGPVDDTTFDHAVEGIANLIGDPETDLAAPDKAHETAGPDEGDEPEVDVSEDVETDDAEDPDGSGPDIKGGRFAPDSAKTTLEDGTVITVAELKRNSLFQRDYTKKTTELAESRKAFEAEKSQVDQQAQSLRDYAEKLTAFSQKFLPKPPEPFTGTADTDPMGYLNYIRQRDEYQAALAEFQGIETGKAGLSEAEKARQEQASMESLRAEMELLKSKDTVFADPGKAKAFIDKAVNKGAEWWGLSPDDIGGMTSHKAFLILRDAVRWREAVARSTETKAQVQAKPIPPAGRRVDPRARTSADRQSRAERLRRSGSVDDAAASIMDLI